MLYNDRVSTGRVSIVQRTKYVVLDSSSSMVPKGEKPGRTTANRIFTRKGSMINPHIINCVHWLHLQVSGHQEAEPSNKSREVMILPIYGHQEAEPSNRSSEVMILPPQGSFYQPLGHEAMHLARIKHGQENKTQLGSKPATEDLPSRRAVTS